MKAEKNAHDNFSARGDLQFVPLKVEGCDGWTTLIVLCPSPKISYIRAHHTYIHIMVPFQKSKDGRKHSDIRNAEDDLVGATSCITLHARSLHIQNEEHHPVRCAVRTL